MKHHQAADLPEQFDNLNALVRRIMELEAAAKTSATKPVFTIEGFCEAHDITKPHYYTLKKQGKGPREMAVGRRRLITQEAAADWRREREQETLVGLDFPGSC